jgi:hypothetical protein
MRSVLRRLLHLIALHGSHFVDDAFENALNRLMRQRAVIVGEYVGVYLIFAFGFVNGEVPLLFDAANSFDNGGALVQQIQKAAIQHVDLAAVLF